MADNCRMLPYVILLTSGLILSVFAVFGNKYLRPVTADEHVLSLAFRAFSGTAAGAMLWQSLWALLT